MKTDSVVLDSSALLALINKEEGSDMVKSILPGSIMSSVNLAEVTGILMARHKVLQKDISIIIRELVKCVISFNEEQAYIVGDLEKVNFEKRIGLSLGDKACISLGKLLNIPIYTADRAWGNLQMQDVEIKVIR